MSFEIYVTYCLLGLTGGGCIILYMLRNLNSRVSRLEEKLRMEDADEDQEDETTT